MRKFLLSTSLFLAFISSGCAVLPVQNSFCHTDETNEIDRMYVVGDSLSDVGALVTVFKEIMHDFCPEVNTDKLLAEPLVNHAFTNGEPVSQVVAKKFGFKLTPAFKIKFGQKTYEKKGNNYAFAGAQASKANFDTINHKDGTPLSFKEFIKKFHKLCKQNFLDCNNITNQVDALLSHHKIKKNDLIFFAIGSNDLMFQAINFSKKQQQKVIANSIKNQKAAIEKLIDNGAKHILMINTPDLGKIPQYKTKKPEKEQIASKISKDYNKEWLIMANNLKKQYHPYIKIFRVDLIFLNLLSQFAQNNFIIDQPAFNYKIKFNKNKLAIETISEIKNDPNKTFFFDDVHPTKEPHKIIGNEVEKFIRAEWKIR